MKTQQSQSQGAARRGRGFSLIECVVYLGAFAVITGLAFSAFYRGKQESLRLRHQAQQIVVTMEAGEQWRSDVRRATAAPHLESSSAGSVLHIPVPGGEVTYRLVDHTIRRRSPGLRSEEMRLREVKTSEFIREEQGGVTAWRWELELRVKSHNIKKLPRWHPRFTFLAVPGRS